MNKPKAIRHGEIILHPVERLPKGKLQKLTVQIVGHSETGHHHVLESTKKFDVLMKEREDLYLRLFEPAKLVHKKQLDKHNTLTVEPGVYHVIYKTEYNPFDKIIERVTD